MRPIESLGLLVQIEWGNLGPIVMSSKSFSLLVEGLEVPGARQLGSVAVCAYCGSGLLGFAISSAPVLFSSGYANRISGGAPRMSQYATRKGQPTIKRAANRLLKTKCGKRGQTAATAIGTAERLWYKNARPISRIASPKRSRVFIDEQTGTVISRLSLASFE